MHNIFFLLLELFYLCFYWPLKVEFFFLVLFSCSLLPVCNFGLVGLWGGSPGLGCEHHFSFTSLAMNILICFPYISLVKLVSAYISYECASHTKQMCLTTNLFPGNRCIFISKSKLLYCLLLFIMILTLRSKQ